MKAVVVTPGQPDSGRVTDVAEPQRRVDEVLVATREVGICGTDIEILHGLYGEAPEGDSHLVLGHENFGEVVESPDGAGVSAGDLVMCIVRRPDPVPCPQCAVGEWDMCSNGRYTERGIKGRHGFMSEYYTEVPEYLVKVSADLGEIGVLMEPLTVVEKAVGEAEAIQRRLTWCPREAVVTGAGPIGIMATLLLRARGYDVIVVDLVAPDSLRATIVQEAGAEYVKGDDEPLRALADRVDGIDLIIEATAVPQLVFDAIDAIGPNGVVALTGVSAAARTLEVPADRLNLEMVLENKVVFGSVNAGRRHYDAATGDLAGFEERWPGLCARILTTRTSIDELAEADDFLAAFTPERGVDVKATVAFPTAAMGR